MTNKTTIAALNKKVEHLKTVIANQVGSIRGMIGSYLGISHNGERDIYESFGYDVDLSGNHGFLRMYGMASRHGIGNRLTSGVARICWRDGFELYESKEDDAKKVLENELALLFKSNTIAYLERADILNRIGRFSVLYVGIPDGRKPEEPLGKVSGGPEMLSKITYVPYAYDGVEILTSSNDITDPRYGLPEIYSLSQQHRGDREKDATTKNLRVHWTRIIHLNENALDSDIEGRGALEPVFNRILDLDKVCGGSAESYFRNSKRIVAYEIDNDFAGHLADDESARNLFDEEAKKFTHGYKDHVTAYGAQVKELQSQHASPEYTIKGLLWEISSYSGYPIRFLIGEGSGQLAGSEDQLAVNQVTRDRQRVFCSPIVVKLFIMLEKSGMLTLPDTFDIRFPFQEAATEAQKVDNNNKKAQTIETIMKAKTSMGGEGLDVKSALAACELTDVEYDEDAIDDLREEMQKQFEDSQGENGEDSDGDDQNTEQD